MILRKPTTQTNNKIFQLPLSLVPLHNVFKVVNEVLSVLQAHAQRGLQTKHVGSGAASAQQHPSFSELLEQLVTEFFAGFLGLLVLDDFDTDHQPGTPGVSDNRAGVGDPLQLGEQVVSDILGVLGQLFPFDGLEHLHAGPADNVASACGVEEVEVGHFSNLLPSDHCSQGEPVADALGHGDDVRLEIVVLVAPELGADPAEASLHLVGDDQASVAADSVDDHGDVPIDEGVDASDALDGLEEHACNMARAVGVYNFQGVPLQGLDCAMDAPVLGGPG